MCVEWNIISELYLMYENRKIAVQNTILDWYSFYTYP